METKRSATKLDVAQDGLMFSFSAGGDFKISKARPVISAVQLPVSRGKNSPARKMKSELHTRRLNAGAIELWQTFENRSKNAVGVTEIELLRGTLEVRGRAWQAVHQELFKGDVFFDGYERVRGRVMAPLRDLEGYFGLSEDSPFPAMGFSHPEHGTILIGVLSQEKCKPIWRMEKVGNRHRLIAGERFFGVPHIEVASGKIFESEHWVVLFSPKGLEDAIERYFQLVRKRIRFVGEKSIMRRAVIWGTWNYNPRPRGKGDIEHDYVVANARALKKLVPNRPCVVAVDDGYQPGRSGERGGTGEWWASAFEYFFDPKKPAWDPKLFPRGMKALMDDVSAAGCVPAMWITPRIRSFSELARKRPEWLLQMGDGRKFPDPFQFLDYSVPEVRDYVHYVWDTVFHQWGIKAVKLDFWTYGFEIPGIRYRHGKQTGVELRNRFLSDLRKYIPEGGYIVSGCTINSGNLFLGRYFDASRNAYDIGYGTWDLLREAATSLTGVAPFFRHDCLLPHSDSIGWCVGNSLSENRLWTTVAVMTGSVCEIGGDLTALSSEARELLKAGIDFVKPARRTRNAAMTHDPASYPADHLVLEREDGVYEAYFNWQEYQRELTLRRPVRDLWTGKRLHGRVLIPPHDVIWFKQPK